MPKVILLADDSVTIRRVVELTFSDTEIRVESVGSGQEALRRIPILEPDLILADVTMAEPSGYEICRQVKISPRPVPVVLLAGTFESFDHDRALACGADGHVMKPFESSFLLQTVESFLKPPVPSDPPATSSSPAKSMEIEGVLEDLAEATGSGTNEDVARPPTDDQAETVEGSSVDSPAVAETVHEGSAGPAMATHTPGSESLVDDQGETPSGTSGLRLTAEDIDTIARAVVERLSTAVIREVAWELVPELAESIIRERIRQLESEIEED